MLKIIDVDWVKDKTLELSFNDGYRGIADLSQFFNQPPFDDIVDFTRFALNAEGSLNWQGNELSAASLRAICQGTFVEKPESLNLQQIEAVIKQASWESMQEGRPDILQAALRAYVEHFGHSAVIARAGIKSRTSAYRSLKPETKPNFATLVQLGHAVIEIAQEQAQTS